MILNNAKNNKQQFSEISLQISEQTMEDFQGLAPNMEYIEDESKFDETQSVMIEEIVPLVLEKSKDLYTEFKLYSKDTYKEVEETLSKSLES
mmetsp:Transcript_6615/g.5714  ORF Transcript_6615/g.5714 Transcript_6615/m.5714 type:complete len:92 (+) Transcript_6615:766-1041(+)